MNLYLRVLILFIRSFFKPKLTSVLDHSVLRFYVLPNDLDINGHMNNSRYLTVMDLGRFDLVLRSGLLAFMRKHGSVPILGAAQIRFRIPLMPFQRYDLDTNIIGWDDKWFFIEQRFLIVDGKKKGAVAAIAVVKGSFYDSRNKRTVPTAELMTHMELAGDLPDLPDHLIKWQDAEASLRDLTKID